MPKQTTTNDDRDGTILDSVGIPNPAEEAAPEEEEEVRYVLEGTPEAEELEKTPERKPPATKDDLERQLLEMNERIKAAEEGVNPVKQFGKQLEQVVQRVGTVYPQQQVSQPQETAEQRIQRLNNMWMENPAKAYEEQSREQLRPVLDIMFSTQAALSRDLALMDPNQKPIYDKYRDEVEQEVTRIPPQERIQEPRVYQTAIQRVKARHSDELTQSAIEEAVNKRLQELGIDPAKAAKRAKPAVYSPAGQQRSQGGGLGGPRTEVIPKWVQVEAAKIGLSAEFLYQHLKEKGELKGGR